MDLGMFTVVEFYWLARIVLEKTSLKKSLLGLPFNPKEQSTEEIQVDPSVCEIEVEQEDLLDLITALLKFNCFLSTTFATQCIFPAEAIFDDSLITVDSTALDQHKLYYRTISRSRCDISDDVIVLIWNFLRDMYGQEDTNSITNRFLSLKSRLNLIAFFPLS